MKETAAPASSTRSAKPKAPRVKAAQHSKAVPGELVASQDEPAVAQGSSENAQEAIAAIAYSYWEARGCEGDAPLEDWVRAENEYQNRLK